MREKSLGWTRKFGEGGEIVSGRRWIRDSPIPFETNEESRRHVGNRELNRIEGSFFEINWIYPKWNQELERIDLLEFFTSFISFTKNEEKNL